ncbi:MAG: hypothetical protein GTO60_09795, partial [Gammaproteobacteria bacterium]|nr:hypothetical protein [Gammaproteobacteria bacterium]
DEMGSIEKGKLADLIVLDKDYFDEQAVPDNMIKTIRPLMTLMNGKAQYLDPSLASEFGLNPVGIHPE